MSTGLVCTLCGHVNEPDAAFCRVCGHELEGVASTSLFRLLLHHVQEILESLGNPVLAFFKTLWLVVFRPVSLYRALMRGEPPIERLGFPLQFLWKWLFPEVRPYILDPMEFLLSSVALALVLGVASEMEGVFSESAETFNQAQDLVLLNPVTSSEINLITDLSVNFMALLLVIFLLAVLLGAAAVYRFWLGWGRPQARRVLTQGAYYFWFYGMGAVTLTFLFGRFLPKARGWDTVPGWQYWVPMGTTAVFLLFLWLFGVAPFLVFREWTWIRVTGAVATSWIWLAVIYGFWVTVGQELFVWPVVIVMMFLLLMAALPPWLWICCLTPLGLFSIGALGFYRKVLQRNRKQAG